MTQAVNVKKGQFAPVPVPKGPKADALAPPSLQARLRDFLLTNRLPAASIISAIIVSICYAIYIFGISSNLYTSETRFAIRQVQNNMSSDLLTDAISSTPERAEIKATQQAAALAKGGAGGDADFEQNPFVIANFLMSRAFVREIWQQGWLQSRFANHSVDFLSRLSPNATLEEAWRFWMRHVMAAVDRSSNTIVLQVWAFTPEDAQATVEMLIKRAESIMNDIETRGRQDALDRARVELQRASEEYDRKLNQISDMRQLLATVDPKQAAKTAQSSFFRFEAQRILMERELQVLQTAENANSPSANTLRQRSKSMLAEVDQLHGRITGSEADMRAAVNALASYEELDINRRFALMRVQIASLAVENAEMLLREHSYFIYTFIAPSLPTQALQAWRVQQWLLVTFIAFVSALAVITFGTLSRDSRY
ncbi:hypothetical protein [Ancylobacter defluvii]|uniref:Capsular polysaccharide transport system permease protein n=1 Tax=Ancylobacter defluvii TaxID=1282440 RepID=A0A9W6NAX9_9HYPH|nr:hypothetical protein [Ancylobacter defluvii]MBS7588656.1 hypothetical protein [Ancylobacter defluvii]GLK83936.1 hypothetical protein GCM10017653_20060 [Ancylobacter defluvii]